MENRQFILYNGNIFPYDEFALPISSTLWQKYFCEQMRSAENQIFFLGDHLKQIKFYVDYAKFELPSVMRKNGARFQREVARLLNKNKFYKGSIVKVYIGEKDWLVMTEPIPARSYELEIKPEILDIFETTPKSINLLSMFEPQSRLTWQYAQNFCDENQISNCIIINEEKNICDAIAQNIFLIKRRTLYTPPMNSGCYHDIIREKILSVARVLEFEVEDQKMISVRELLRADEAFLASASQGIYALKGIRARRYYNRYTKEINEGLNGLLTGML